MTAPSNANTSGLVEKLLERARVSTDPLLAMYASQASKQLVTAASAQARIAELESALAAAQNADAENDAHLRSLATAAEARADRLAKFGQHTNWEMSHGYPDGEEEDGCWLVHSVNGGRNDREWTLIGRGETPDDAIRAALQQETQP